jgi:hypothetical protein
MLTSESDEEEKSSSQEKSGREHDAGVRVATGVDETRSGMEGTGTLRGESSTEGYGVRGGGGY